MPARTLIERNFGIGTMSEFFGHEKAFNSKNFRIERMADDAAISSAFMQALPPIFRGINIPREGR